jgi:hypothetical protein
MTDASPEEISVIPGPRAIRDGGSDGRKEWDSSRAIKTVLDKTPQAELQQGRKSKRGPRNIEVVKKQIVCHPKYNDLSPETRWAFETGVLCGLSWADKENNRWSRQLWAHLYRHQPLPS